jgi:hypothetical protein
MLHRPVSVLHGVNPLSKRGGVYNHVICFMNRSDFGWPFSSHLSFEPKLCMGSADLARGRYG